MKNSDIFDLIGVGVGPFNLGLAALLDKVDGVNAEFLETNPRFSWHENMLIDGAKLQVHYLKDLVSLVDPTSKFSFLAYLVSQNRIHQFINRKTNIVSREEFNKYYQWVANNIKGIKFNKNVQAITYNQNKFVIQAGNEKYESNNIVIGVGTVPYIPDNFAPLVCNTLFHNTSYKEYKTKLNFAGKKIAVIGGGQSGAEVFNDIISSPELPAKISWISRRSNFHPLEDSCFTNEFYIPSYTKYFSGLSERVREQKLDEQKFTSDGITQELIDVIYNKIYELKFIKNVSSDFNLLLNSSASAIKSEATQHTLEILDLDKNKAIIEDYDIVILATGYAYKMPNCLSNLFPSVSNIKDLKLNKDYSVEWKHGNTNKIFIQNGMKHVFGIADSNLSLSTWRNAVIINSLLNRKVYETNYDSPLIASHNAPLDIYENEIIKHIPNRLVVWDDILKKGVANKNEQCGCVF